MNSDAAWAPYPDASVEMASLICVAWVFDIRRMFSASFLDHPNGWLHAPPPSLRCPPNW
jgi:hypothetical protein